MNRLLGLLIFICFILVSSTGLSQDIGGKWYGKLTQGPGAYSELYDLELTLTQQKQISGESYSYIGNEVEVRMGLSGSINGNNVKLQESQDKILQEKIPPPWELCIKKYVLAYRKEGNHEYLQGDWSGTGKITEKKACPINNSTIGGSIGEREFAKQDSLILGRVHDNLTGSKEDCVPGGSIEGGGKCIPGLIILARSKEELAEFFANGGFDNPIPVSTPPDLPLPVFTPDFKTTSINKITEIEVTHPSLQLRLYDYLKIDNDTISVYLNRNPLIKNVRIAKQAITMDFNLDPRIDINEILLFAENLGKVPPNTSLLEIVDGKHTFRIKIESDKQKTAAIYLRYKPLKPTSNE